MFRGLGLFEGRLQTVKKQVKRTHAKQTALLCLRLAHACMAQPCTGTKPRACQQAAHSLCCVQADFVRFPANVSMTKRGLSKLSLPERSQIVSGLLS